jgi:F-type H+-transporting ATPase subunit gamma
MQTIESLRRKIKSTQDLLSVVKTMKALAAVSIRQYQRSVESLVDYNDAVERGLQILLRAQEESHPAPGPVPLTKAGVIVSGRPGSVRTIQRQVVSHALDELEMLKVPNQFRYILSVGER